MEARDRGMEQALISASNRPIVDVVLQANPGIFSFAIAAGDLPRTKPDPLPYMEAAKRFGLQPKDCLVVEDSKVGVTSGLGSGALVLALAHFQEIPQSSNIFIRSSLEGVSLDELTLLHSAWRNDGALI
jgi:beta-phosphoglucomutase-like phosphatase (HAD superfamily)